MNKPANSWLDTYCGSCGQKNDLHDKYCMNCGTSLISSPAETPVSTERQYTPQRKTLSMANGMRTAAYDGSQRIVKVPDRLLKNPQDMKKLVEALENIDNSTIILPNDVKIEYIPNGTHVEYTPDGAYDEVNRQRNLQRAEMQATMPIGYRKYDVHIDGSRLDIDSYSTGMSSMHALFSASNLTHHSVVEVSIPQNMLFEAGKVYSAITDLCLVDGWKDMLQRYYGPGSRIVPEVELRTAEMQP